MLVPLVLQLAEHNAKTLWLVQDPSTWGLVTAGVVAGAGLIAAAWLLRSGEEEPLQTQASPLDAELREIQLARANLLRELEGSPPALRGALRPLLDGPLLDYDQRVGALIETARAEASPQATPDTETQRARLQAELDSESDPRARALLEASLRDLEATRQLQIDLARNGRLALLELRRMRTLLASLPARVRELASRRGLEHSDSGDVEAIARQLEGAVHSTREVMEGALSALPERPTP